jgi:PPK2 family polyphosphate:nucleotide phosphotransferase
MSLKNEPTGPKEGADKKTIEAETEKYKEELFKLQNLLYAGQKYSMLIILQGMDAAGKDGTVRHVFSSLNPMGICVKAFKQPTTEEMTHDFLWRVHPHAPARGMMQVFNRSHYEDILVPSVHKTVDKEKIEKRYDLINAFEQGLVDNDTIILKFFLHISQKEQAERIKERLTVPEKKWKYDPADKKEAANWDAYMEVYEKILKKCSPEIPWNIVPADYKWYRNYIIAKTIADKLRGLKLKYPA